VTTIAAGSDQPDQARRNDARFAAFVYHGGGRCVIRDGANAACRRKAAGTVPLACGILL
jgi:hypothetical protein